MDRLNKALEKIYWHRIITFVRNSKVTTLSLYMVTVNGFLIGLKIRLVGKNALADRLDGDGLIVSAVLLLSFLFAWAVVDILTSLFAPPELIDAPKFSEYMLENKDSMLDEEHYQESFIYLSEKWDDQIKSRPFRKMVVLDLIAVACILAALSQLALFLSSLHALREIVDVAMNPHTPT